MTQVTQLIIPPSKQHTRNLIKAIFDVATKRPASQETMQHIQTLATEAIATMNCARQQPAQGGRKKIKGDS